MKEFQSKPFTNRYNRLVTIANLADIFQQNVGLPVCEAFKAAKDEFEQLRMEKQNAWREQYENARNLQIQLKREAKAAQQPKLLVAR